MPICRALRKYGRIAAAAAAGLLAFGSNGWAQGCVMCYTSAAALNKAGAYALDKAIITLWIPPALIFGGIFTYFIRHRDSHDSASEDSSE